MSSDSEISDPFDFLAQSEDQPGLSSEDSALQQEATTYGKLVNEIQTFRIDVFPYHDDYLSTRSSAPTEEKPPSRFVSQDSKPLAESGADFKVFPGQLFEDFNSFVSHSSTRSMQEYNDKKSYGDHKFIEPSGGTSAGGWGGLSMRQQPRRVAVALKISIRSINRSNNRPVILGAFLREVRAMGRLQDSPYIVKLLGIAFVEMDVEVRPTLVVELALGNAVDCLKSSTYSNSINWDTKCRFIIHIGTALQAVHTAGLIHADVKAKNVLIFPDTTFGFCAKLSDFGNSVAIDSPPPRAPGTAEYLPPECLHAEESQFSSGIWLANGRCRDIYTLGLFIWELATHCQHDAPFKELGSPAAIASLKTASDGAASDYILASVPKDAPSLLRELITRTVVSTPSHRSPLDAILESLQNMEEGHVSHVIEHDVTSSDRTFPEESKAEGQRAWVDIPWSLQKRLYEESTVSSDQRSVDAKIYLAYCYILFSEGSELRDSALEHVRQAARRNPFHLVDGSLLTPFAAMLQMQDWEGLATLLLDEPVMMEPGRLSPTSDQFLSHIISFGWQKLIMLACEAGSTELDDITESYPSVRRSSEVVALSTIKLLNVNGSTNFSHIATAERGFTALHWASLTGKLQLVGVLLANGFDSEVREFKGRTALHLCCQSRLLSDTTSKEVAKILLEHGPESIDTVMPERLYTPLRFAVDVQKPDLCEYLVMSGADVNASAQHGSTPLQECGWVTGFRGNGERGEGSKDEQKALQIARILINSGRVDINKRSCHNQVTALAVAATHGNFTDMVALLLNHGADPNVHCDDPTALRSAVELNNWRMFTLLLDHDADPNFTDSGKTPLAAAIYLGNYQMVSTLLERGAKANVQVPNHNSKSPISYTINSIIAKKSTVEDALRMLDLLFRHYGDQISAPMSESKPPFNLAANWGYLPIVKMLIDHGASLSDLDKDGLTVLHDVVISARVEESEGALIRMMTLLVEHGAEIDAVDDKGATPLHLACAYRIEYLIEYLLSIGSCRTLKNLDGMTPRELYLIGDWYTKKHKLPVLASTLASLHTN